MATLSLSPVGFFPVLFIALGLLFILLESAPTAKDAFKIAWLFGFGYCFLSLYWISFALHVDWQNYKWLAPLAAAGLPFGFAFYYAISGYLFQKLKSKSQLANVFLFTVLFSLCELARGTFLTGFPWNFFAHGWGEQPIMLQSLSIWGLYGLSLVTIFLCTLPVIGRIGVWTSFACLVGLMVFGFVRLQEANNTELTDANLLLIQPNIKQVDKWNPQLKPAHIAMFSDMMANETEITKMVILPETAVTYPVESKHPLLQELTEKIGKNDKVLTGAIRRDDQGRFYNSLLELNDQGEILNIYDKHHLVPFGEYMPLRGIINMLPIAAASGDFSRGVGAVTLGDGNGSSPSFSPLICYEVIFPDAVIADGTRPDFLLNITNDAWYLNSIGPYQHLTLARFRAIEEGIPLVRVANTGISAIFDGYGRLLASLPLGQKGIIELKLPQANEESTFFRKTSGKMHFILLIVCLTFYGVLNFLSKQEKE